ncbi:unnamed protein product [Didymodactylos carnosus]|uniref:Fibrinogen C-terminal domain-containing protein n=1 Tax=Didymodactylos carnosus TaxID=1234261 RepID=A0A8S2WWK2_9BILA|nr:unnamed protein product [Didymodactylos carnosus]CAF4466323.1 unnamed protein product [Didymodactylos carnosus]
MIKKSCLANVLLRFYGKKAKGLSARLIISLGKPFRVFCDMTTDGSGDYNPLVDFYRTWLEYKRGFSDLERQYWLGNDRLSMLTNQDSYCLRVDLEDFDQRKRFAVYHSFSVSNELDKYRMSLGMYLNGDAGDSLYVQNDQRFSTKDQDDDSGVRDCAKVFNGAWWYNDCHQTNLNGGYLRGYHPTVLGTGASWYLFRGNGYSLKPTEMKIRPIWFKP